jgi:predicted nuclease of predicted toxin-antitoxin system
MRFLVDECTGPTVATWLREQGYEVYSVFETARGITDDEVLRIAADEGWILVTNDKDFGEMIFRERRTHRGVIFLRVSDERSANKIAVLKRLIENYSTRLPNQFVTVTETRVRFA